MSGIRAGWNMEVAILLAILLALILFFLIFLLCYIPVMVNPREQ